MLKVVNHIPLTRHGVSRLLVSSRTLCLSALPCFAAAAATVAQAQHGARALGVAFEAGVYHGAFRDDVASPLRYGGWGQQARLTGSLASRHLTFRAHLAAASATLRSSITSGALPVEKLIVSTASIAVLRELKMDRPLRVGPEFIAGFEARDHHFSPPAEVLRFGLAYTALAARAERRWTLGTRTVVTELGVPVLTAVARPPSDLRLVAHEGLRWNVAAPWTFRALDYRLAYVPRVVRHVGWSASHRAAYRRYADPKRYGSVENSFTVSLAYGRGSQ